MDDILIGNLQRTQAFDSALKSGDQIDVFAARLLNAVMFQKDPKVRADAITKLEADVVGHFSAVVQPKARALGLANAKAIVAALPPDERLAGLSDAKLRQRILVEGNLRPAKRLEIVRALVHDKGNTLDNRLAAFWLEPGVNDKAKLGRLVELHNREAALQTTYNRELSAWLAGGQKGSKPRKPQVDFLARFANDVKADTRTQARRAGTDAETAEFVKQGYTVFAWVTVNASEACKDCKARNGTKGDIPFWESFGKPGSGKTVCGANCYCLLVPAETLTANPQLAAKGVTYGGPKPTPATPAAPAPAPAPVKAGPPTLAGARVGTFAPRTDTAEMAESMQEWVDSRYPVTTDAAGRLKRERPDILIGMEDAVRDQSRTRSVVVSATGTPRAAAAWEVSGKGKDRVMDVASIGWREGDDTARNELVRQLVQQSKAQKARLQFSYANSVNEDGLTAAGLRPTARGFSFGRPQTAAVQRAIGKPQVADPYQPFAERLRAKLTADAAPDLERKRSAIAALITSYPQDGDRFLRDDEIRGKVLDVLRLKPAERATVRGAQSAVTVSALKAEIDRGQSFLSQIMRTPSDPRSGSQLSPAYELLPPGGRAFCAWKTDPKANGRIALAPTTDAAVVVHELGHEMEFTVNGQLRASLAFKEYRLAGQRPERMDLRFPGHGYTGAEMGADDEWGKLYPTAPAHAYYVGKDYGRNGSEITSMGLEMLYRDPIKLASTDPEYARFILSALDGRLAEKPE